MEGGRDEDMDEEGEGRKEEIGMEVGTEREKKVKYS